MVLLRRDSKHLVFKVLLGPFRETLEEILAETSIEKSYSGAPLLSGVISDSQLESVPEAKNLGQFMNASLRVAKLKETCELCTTASVCLPATEHNALQCNL